MSTACAGNLLARLAQVPDPRGRQGRRHSLSAMLAAVVSGLISGVGNYTELVEWLHDLPVDFCHKLGFTRRPPKLDCFRDLLMALDTQALDQVLRDWILEFFPHAQNELLAVLSLDGKCLRGSARARDKGVHLLALVVHGSRAVLAQGRVDEKTNEHKGALELLEHVLLKDTVVVGDAAFCQRDLCEQILAAEGDDLLAVKRINPCSTGRFRRNSPPPRRPGLSTNRAPLQPA